VTIGEQIREREAQGYRVIQSGRVREPGRPGTTFADRVEGCTVSLIRSGDVLLDNDERWVHMQLREPTNAA